MEFTSGAKLTGKVVARDDAFITLEVTMGDHTYSRKCPVDRIHAVTIGERREIINEKPAGSHTPPPTTTSPGPSATPPRTGAGSAMGPSATFQQTPTQIVATIDRLGRTQPDWWETVPLDYPRTLDLQWPMPPSGNWNSQRNVGQYVWDIINPNPNKWRGGVRFMHHMLSVHKDNPTVRVRAMKELGRMYHDLLQDYPRAAFWWRAAGVDKGDRTRAGVQLAATYWKLGSKPMAMELLDRVPLQFASIKLLADMGETEQALRLAEANMRGPAADLAYLYAGDACRIVGQHEQALKYYEGCLNVPAVGQAAQRIQRNQQRARANIEAIRLFEMLDLRRVADGTYRGSGPGYAGQILVEVAVRAGRIDRVRVVSHKEKQFYSAISDTSRKIVEKQGVKGVDTTSGATITSEAIINATAKALTSGMK